MAGSGRRGIGDQRRSRQRFPLVAPERVIRPWITGARRLVEAPALGLLEGLRFFFADRFTPGQRTGARSLQRRRRLAVPLALNVGIAPRRPRRPVRPPASFGVFAPHAIAAASHIIETSRFLRISQPHGFRNATTGRTRSTRSEILLFFLRVFASSALRCFLPTTVSSRGGHTSTLRRTRRTCIRRVARSFRAGDRGAS